MKTGKKMIVAICCLFAALSTAHTGLAADGTILIELDRIMHLDLPGLHEEASRLLDRLYPEEDWDSHNFPPFVYTSGPIEAGYKVAVKQPEILKQTFCYCFCDAMDHASLLSCYWKDGKVGGSFDEHAAYCNICISQALQALLVYNLGASEQEVDKLMEKRFQNEIEQNKAAKTDSQETAAEESSCDACGEE